MFGFVPLFVLIFCIIWVLLGILNYGAKSQIVKYGAKSQTVKYGAKSLNH